MPTARRRAQRRGMTSTTTATTALATTPAVPAPPRPRLARSRTGRMLGGVAGGLAEYTGVDAVLWRVAFVALTVAGGGGLLAYVLLWLLVPAAEDTSR
jgi:phage shock protein PspC (stress-responsive transcriptional regulator)